jgi:periplasmic divalent cation tolerance protein
METPESPAAAHLVAFTTASSAEEGRRLASALVASRLVACGTVIPGGVSVYRWRGAVEEQQEVLVILKTTAERWPALVAAFPGLHPYEVPELIALPVVHGFEPYLRWVSEETSTAAAEKEQGA